MNQYLKELMLDEPVNKVCPRCSRRKPLDKFALNKSRKDGHDSVCKKCRAKAERLRCKKDPRRASRKSKAFREKNKEWLEFKEELFCKVINWVKMHEGCAITGETEGLVFHYLDPGTKKFSISDSRKRSWKSIIREMLKCVVVTDVMHIKIHKILEGQNVTDFPPALVKFMEDNYQMTFRRGSWVPMLKVIRGGLRKSA